MLGNKIVIFAGVGISAVIILLFAVVPSLATSTPPEFEDVETVTPPVDEMPYFEDDYPDNDWFPTDRPATGTPHIIALELQGKPDSFITVQSSEASWIQIAAEKNGEPLALTQEDSEDFFSAYEKVEEFTPYFEVSYPDGSVKYYQLIYTEVP
jgi:hypothetical protein